MFVFAPFDPDPECPFCSGEGFKRNCGQVGRCDCTNCSRYAQLRRTGGLTMKQAMEALTATKSRNDWPPSSPPPQR
jgi:hypothetical protein